MVTQTRIPISHGLVRVEVDGSLNIIYFHCMARYATLMSRPLMRGDPGPGLSQRAPSTSHTLGGKECQCVVHYPLHHTSHSSVCATNSRQTGSRGLSYGGTTSVTIVRWRGWISRGTPCRRSPSSSRSPALAASRWNRDQPRPPGPS